MPKPSAGEGLVRIHAAGVNPYETYMRAEAPRWTKVAGSGGP
jgi:NADPH:quinone reductase-like Zn-dependent oxidoreductase